MKQALLFIALLAVAMSACRVPSPPRDTQHDYQTKQMMQQRQAALNKLTDADKKALGLNED